jgi:hypothetical protein
VSGRDCASELSKTIRALLPNWDISIEEVPWYLAGQFGEATFRQAIEDLNREALDHRQRVSLDTVLYWADIFWRLVGFDNSDSAEPELQEAGTLAEFIAERVAHCESGEPEAPADRPCD